MKEQIAEATESILSNMAEGFEQSTDAAVANYLYMSKGSVAEVVTRIKSAQRCGCHTAAECAQCVATGDEIGRMLGGWIKYLARCDWKNRRSIQGPTTNHGQNPSLSRPEDSGLRRRIRDSELARDAGLGSSGLDSGLGTLDYG